ncbi:MULTISPECIES: DUF4113 domain-containing protein [Aeromonas]
MKYHTRCGSLRGKKWVMRRECLTPQYSTKWHSLPSIKC